MAAHKYYETMKGKGCIGIQYVYHVGKKGKRIRNTVHVLRERLPWALALILKHFHYSTKYST